MTVKPSVQLTQANGVAELCLQQPPCNEIGSRMVDGLERALEQLDGARVVLLHSALATGFSAGADLRELQAAVTGRSPEAFMPELSAMLDRIHAVMDRIDRLPIPTVAAVSGVCFGGGFELALTCDVIVADRSARFCFPESRLGLIPGFGGIPRLRREVSNAVIRDLLFCGRSLSAKRAHELGLCAQLTGIGHALAAARDCARQMALFESEVLHVAKDFAKPIPVAELQAEKQRFLALFKHPRVVAALDDFVGRNDPMPYQPRRGARHDS